jgi:hypothetical protein
VLLLARRLGRPPVGEPARRREYVVNRGSVLRKNYVFVYVFGEQGLTAGCRISTVATMGPSGGRCG